MPKLRLRSAALALAVLVLGQVSAWAHDGAVRHVLCARHGELVDAPQLARAIATGSWLVAVDGSPSDDHCAIANGIRHDATSVRGPAVLATALPAIAVHRVAPASRPRRAGSTRRSEVADRKPHDRGARSHAKHCGGE